MSSKIKCNTKIYFEKILIDLTLQANAIILIHAALFKKRELPAYNKIIFIYNFYNHTIQRYI